MVTREEILNSGARDLIDVLSLVPGIEFNSDVWGIVGISIKGNLANSGKILLMIDGQEQNELAFSALFFGNHYPVENIERIEIIRGPGSAIYGGFAELGVINIITSKGSDIDGVKFDAGYGRTIESNRYGGNLSVGKKIKDLDIWTHTYYAEANKSDRDYNGIYGDKYNMKESSELKPLMINTGLKFKDLQVLFNYDDYNTTSRDGSYEVLLKDYPMNYRTITGEIKYDFKISDKLSVIPKFNYVSSHPWSTVENAAANESSSFYKYDRTVNRYKGGITASFDPTNKINIIGGAEYIADYAKDNFANEIDSWRFWNGEFEIDYSNIAGFFQSIIQTDIVNLTVGTRVENHSEYGFAMAPRIGITKTLNKVHFKLLYNRAFRSPSVEEIDYNSWLDVVNHQPDIKPEKTDVFEFETGYNFADGMSLLTNVYYIKIDDAIQWIVNTSSIGGYDNLGQTGTTGFELEYRVRKKWGYVNMNYSFYTSEGINKVPDYTVPGKSSTMLGTPQHKGNFNSSFNIIKGLSINPSINLKGKRFSYNSYDALNGNLIIKEYDPIALVNLYINYRNFLFEGLNIGVGAYNLLNQEYDYLSAYNSYHGAIPSRDLEFIAKLSYNFKF